MHMYGSQYGDQVIRNSTHQKEASCDAAKASGVADWAAQQMDLAAKRRRMPALRAAAARAYLDRVDAFDLEPDGLIVITAEDTAYLAAVASKLDPRD